MAITVTKLSPNPDFVAGNKRFKFRKLTFSGNYATNGESLTAAQLGLKRVDAVIGGAVGQAADGATANALTFTPNAARTSVLVETYESGAANAALAEKTNAEAHATGLNVTVIAVGS